MHDHLQESGAFELADARTLEVIDFPAIRTRLAQATMTDRGRVRVERLAPNRDLIRVRLEQTATSEMRRIVAADGFALARVVETRDAVERAARGSSLAPEELRSVAIALAVAEAAIRRVRASEAPVLVARTSGATAQNGVVARIDHAIGERGEVLDRASPALGRIRRGISQAHEEARSRCNSILRSAAFAKAIQEPIVTTRAGRFVIPVKAEFSGLVPGVVHDTSASGHTLFVEPLAALETNNRVRTLRIEEEREVARVLADLSALVGAASSAIETNVDILADLDVVLARATLADRMDANEPELVDEPTIAIVAGRHPLLGERAVAQSLRLDETQRFIVISGPNMGGKTVTLKMTGLFVVMAYCGMALPAAAGTTVGGFGQLSCDIGDEQSIVENASTFSAHLGRLRAILERADSRSLVLIDEIASGTEPAAGAALAIAFLERLLALGARGIVTTHATELKLFAHATVGVQNASVRFHPATHVPTYELDLGAPGQSLAFPLARALGLSPEVVDRAESLLTDSERDYDRALSELAEIRAQAATERDALQRERAHAEQLAENARRRIEALERERRELATRAEERLARALRDFAAELERRAGGMAAPGKVTSGQAALLGRVLEEVHRDLGISPRSRSLLAHNEPARHEAGVGDRVFVDALGTEGDVVDDFGDGLLVAVGAMKTVVPKRDVRVVQHGSDSGRPRGRSGAETGAALLEAASGARAELDVRGKRFVEAEPIVDRWIDEAKLLGISPLRLIHGKGTGLLGRGLQQFLKEHGDVGSVRYGNPNEGGSGVTVLELR
ncbi:MAG: Smr/MutS family protein [Candidatus Baltobacteraceae bacterium]